MIIYPEEEAVILRQLINVDNYRVKNEIRKRYFDGTVIPPSVKMAGGRRRVVESSVGWARTAINRLNERLSLQGYTGEYDDNPYGVNDIAEENDIESIFSLGTRDAFKYGTSFFTVANGQDWLDPEVVISGHDPSYATADYSLRSRLVTSGITTFPDDPERGDFLTSEAIIPFGLHEGKIFADGERINHGLNRVPMVQLLNAPDAGSTRGHSELTVPMMKMIDFVIRTMDNIEGGRELFAWGQRYLVTDQQFKDADGNPIDPFIAAMNALWRIPLNTDKTKPDIGMLPSNSPKDLLDLLRLWAQMFASECALPERYFGISPDANPPSADSIRADEAPLNKKADSATRQFSRGASEIGTLSLLVRDGKLPDDYKPVRPLWADVATIAPGAGADRAVKLVQPGILQPTSRILLSELGYTKAQQDTIIRENNAATGGVLEKLLATEPDVEPASPDEE